MIYPYKCCMCGDAHDVIKPAALSGREEICPVCTIAMTRIYTVPRLNLMTVSVADREMCARHKIETGGELVPIGDSKPQAAAPELSEYPDLHEISQEYHIDG